MFVFRSSIAETNPVCENINFITTSSIFGAKKFKVGDLFCDQI